MRLITFSASDASPRLAVVAEGAVYDLARTPLGRGVTLHALLSEEVPVHVTLERLAACVDGVEPTFELHGLLDEAHQRVGDAEIHLRAPIDRQEVWAAGVTYKRSEEARKEESEG